MTTEPLGDAEPWHGTVSGYVSRKCRCAACKAAHNEYHRTNRAIRVAKAKEQGTSLYLMRAPTAATGDEAWHGTTNGYGYHKCRCERCKAANTKYLGGLKRARITKRREADAAAGAGPNPMRGTGLEPWHGTTNGYDYHDCRCDRCRAAQQQYSSAYFKENREIFKARAAAWREANRERFNANARRYIQENREKIKEQIRQRLEANPELRERNVARTRAWRAANPELVRSLGRASYHANKEVKRAATRRWQAANPEKTAANLRLQRAFYKARRRNAPAIRFTQAQLEQRMAYWGNCCYMCGGPFEAIEHVKPLARGGPHALLNLRPVCNRHNAEKHARWLGPEWIMGLTGALRADESIPFDYAAA